MFRCEKRAFMTFIIIFPNVEHHVENVTPRLHISMKKKYQLETKSDCLFRFYSFFDPKYMHCYSRKSSRIGFTVSERTDKSVKQQKITKCR